MSKLAILAEGATILLGIGLEQFVLPPCSAPLLQDGKDLSDLVLCEIKGLELLYHCLLISRVVIVRRVVILSHIGLCCLVAMFPIHIATDAIMSHIKTCKCLGNGFRAILIGLQQGHQVLLALLRERGSFAHQHCLQGIWNHHAKVGRRLEVLHATH